MKLVLPLKFNSVHFKVTANSAQTDKALYMSGFTFCLLTYSS